MRHRFRDGLFGVAFAALAVFITPALLFAHARLVRSTPTANATLTAPPTSLSLWYSERPELKFTSLQLLDSSGAAISLGALAHTTGDATGVTATIASALANGRYTVVWRTAAADGHATNGKFSFVVSGAPAAVQPAPANVPAVISPVTPFNLQDSQNGGATNSIVEAVHASTYTTAMRWAELVGLLSLIGCVVYRLAVIPRAGWNDVLVADSSDRARRLAHATLVLFAAATLMRLVAQSDLVSNASVARMDAIVATVRDTHWGHGWTIGAVGALVAFVTLTFSRKGLSGWAATGVAVVAMCLGESLTGHAAALPARTALAVATDVAHVLGAGGWVGGLLAVVLCGLATLSKASDAERPAAGSKLVRSYHSAAMECVAIVLLSALIAVPLRLHAVHDLWDTPYGRTLLVKFAAVVVALGFGFYHWRTAIVPDWTPASRATFRRSAAGELLVSALVVAATAVLIGTAMP